MAYRYTDVNTRFVYSAQYGPASQAGKTVKFWSDSAGTVPVDVALWLADTPEAPGPSLGVNKLTVQADSMWPAMWDRVGTLDHMWIQIGTPGSPGALYKIYCDADQRLDTLSASLADLSGVTNTALASKVDVSDLVVNALDYAGVDKTGVIDSTTGLQNAINAGQNGSTFIPAGTYKVSSTLSIKGVVYGVGPGTILNATALISMSTVGCTMRDLKVISSQSYAIAAANSSRVTIRNVEILQDATAIAGGATVGFQGFNTPRIRLINNVMNFSGFELSQCADFLIDGNYWDCNYQNIDEPTHISRGTRGTFVNNTVYRSASDCLDMYSDGAWSIIANNRFLSPRLTGINGSIMEVKTVYTDNPGNSSEHDFMQNSSIISNNVFRDVQISTGSGTRTAMNIFYLDTRTTPSFAVGNTAVGMIVSNNILEGFQVTETPTASWVAINFTGHNTLINNNIIRNMNGVSATPQYGITLSEPLASGVSLGVKSVGVHVVGNLIAGIGGNPGRGIYAGNLENCRIDGNTIRTDEWSGQTTKLGIDFAPGAQVVHTSISDNNIQCNISAGFGIRANDTTTKLLRCRIDNNLLRDCGVLFKWLEYCQFNGNNFNNPTNGQGVTFGDIGTTSLGLSISNNQFFMANNNCIIMTNVNGFTAGQNVFKGVARPFYAFGATKNGVILGTLSATQGLGSSVIIFDAGVSGGDQASTYVDTNSNKIIP